MSVTGTDYHSHDIYICISDSGVCCTVWVSKTALLISQFLFGQIGRKLY
jgi:hypothetical protein